jgi:hypothetical protein
MSKTHEGYLLIVDITGYTRYLSESELEHAQETLTALLGLLVENTRPPLIISRLAGDAVISYGLREDFFQGQSFIEMIETTYVTFRKALERLVLNNTCGCNACANIGSLDLKFFIHYGTFGIQRISDYDELVGSDINLLHRLLKNNVTEEIGYQAYALYTDAAIQQLDLEEIRETLTHHTGIQRISDYEELVGSDINLLHRLLKNNIVEEIGYQAYALYTEAAIQQLDVEEIGETLTHHHEEYEHLGMATHRADDRKRIIAHVQCQCHQRILA